MNEIDLQTGTKALRYFWDWNKRFNPNTFIFSFDEFLNFYGNKKNIIASGIGGAIRETGFSDSQVETSMRSLANSSKGKIPSAWYDYFKAFNNEVGKVNWIDAVSFVAVESSKDLLDGAVQIGDTLITTGKILKYIGPLLIIGAIGYIVFKRSKQLGGS